MATTVKNTSFNGDVNYLKAGVIRFNGGIRFQNCWDGEENVKVGFGL